MSFKSTTSVILAAMTLSGAALAQTAAPAAPTPDWTVTGNAGLYSDYRFRGFTQTDYGPAFQGGIDLAHKSGFYLGNWNSNINSTLFNGASLEIDLYGGYKGAITEDLGFDAGLIYYYYPKSGAGSSFNTNGTAKIDNTEVYFGLTYGPFSGKLYYAVNDYFDLARLGNFSRSTKGSTYLDLGYSQEVFGVILGAHVGYLTLEENDQFVDARGNALSKSVVDYKVSAGKDIGNGYVLTGAIVGTTKKEYFATGQPSTENGGKTRLVVSLSKSF